MLDATRGLIAESGIDAVTVAAVAGRAGVSRTSVYELVGGKADLFAAVVDRAADDFLAEMDDHFATWATEPDRPLDQAVRDEIRFAVDAIAGDPIRLALIREADRHYSVAVRNSRNHIERALADVYERRAAQFGLERAESAQLLATVVLGAVETAAYRASLEPGWPRELVTEWLTHFVLGGILGVESHGLDTIAAFDERATANDV